mmetsp:Transcript_27897/g.41292  ORF Transcript_27897/g.41292 Transcript_27897/m.41292 type:complete len:943 (-) Transcript_27897:232-3060(-)|eukprot:CAMPEP_0195522366 /NCGR_PEP_ID=MMETSP0794_2-20130614/20464_1 /TAXON_ID=515487 /ORGANISM="Stephanopyxis turris, Strain CCMP 815" /LENGTH=942 /DNA_ID=CAMNT_0040652115 /DNA_START=194 /DNA_END=3022 /DNA_ORIENTATION=-
MAPSSSSDAGTRYLFNFVYFGAVVYCAGYFIKSAYNIRLHAIKEYGLVIHEFDPWFNFRATQYLYEMGWKNFFQWFDYKVWYPLGRPVGTTIYPGMQFTAVGLKNYVFGDSMSLNDICCYMPAWFGGVASCFTGLIAYECSLTDNSSGTVFTVLLDLIFPSRKVGREVTLTKHWHPAVEAGVAATAFMAILPAHLMRSVGGGYDNESVAITAMTMTFYFWVRSLRANDPNSHYFGVLTGIAYGYMVAVWGGYVFVLNMIGIHAAALVGMGRFSSKIHRAYTFFYVIGTFLATQVPVVGLTPLKSLEQLGPALVFVAYQLLQFCEIIRKKQKLTRFQAWTLRVKVFIAAAAVGSAVIYLMVPTGYFGPLSSRIRGLFVKHTRTGNPLVDSVAEHQPASSSAYFQYLHYMCYVAPVGFVMVLYAFGDSPSFLIFYGIAAYFFSAKMVRLVILLGPIASALGGIAIGRVFSWTCKQFLPYWNPVVDVKVAVSENGEKKKGGKKKKGATSTQKKESSLKPVVEALKKASDSSEGKLIKKIIGLAFLCGAVMFGKTFDAYCWKMSEALSHPAIMFKAQTRDGNTVLVDDYRDSYLWLKKNTPEDARILAWWDYGYQITGIANRTTVADGNTWNHEHIALLGKVLTTNVKEGHRIARHLADYVLLWAGGGGDDLAKSPHLARIANSVYRDMCPNDPTCRAFGFVDQRGTPSKMMRESFLYNLHGHNIKPGVVADPNRFKEVYQSKYGKVRIFKILGVSKESKQWAADPANRICDVEGGWYCRGQYPPALANVLSNKKDFAQLEDFNKGVDKNDEYTKKYYEDLANPDAARARARATEKNRNDVSQPKAPEAAQQLTAEAIKEISSNWDDTEVTTKLWQLISSGSVKELESWLNQDRGVAFVRSSDGRGPMWWAYEYRNEEIVKLLIKVGVSYKDSDKYGKTPLDMLAN